MKHAVAWPFAASTGEVFVQRDAMQHVSAAIAKLIAASTPFNYLSAPPPPPPARFTRLHACVKQRRTVQFLLCQIYI